jgi:hypothetical protein
MRGKVAEIPGGYMENDLIKVSWTRVNHFGQNATVELFVPGTEKAKQ